MKKVDSITSGLAVIKEEFTSLFRLSMYRNAIYLMLNSAMYALTGFFFWIVAARLYPPEVIGLASSAIAAIGLLSLLSTLGLDYGLLRFLPAAEGDAQEMINSSFTIGSAVTVLSALIYLAGLSIWSPALLPVRNNLLYFLAFTIFALANTMQTFNNQCFIAARQSRFAMIQGSIIAWLRFVPLVLLATSFQQFGIVAAWGLCVVLSVIIAVMFFQPLAYNGHRPFPQINKIVVGRMLRFSFANYIGNIFWTVPVLVLPIMIANLLGPAENAYFYIGWAIAGIVFMIPTAISLSMLAEAAHDENKLVLELKRSLQLIFLLLTPLIIVLLVLGRFFLQFFGKAYSENALQLLWILAVSAIPLSLNYVYITIQRVEKKMRSAIWLSAFIAAATLVSSYFLMQIMGIKGAGIGWLASQGTAAIFTLPYLWHRLFCNPS
jgi:O-antigen/teichoic acid export membrane protein